MPRKTNKKVELVEAGLRLFARQGVHATSTREIAQEAGTTEGNIYRHFADKNDLVRAVFDQCAAKLQVALSAVVPDSDAPADRLASLLGALFDFAETDHDAFIFILHAYELGIAPVGRMDPRRLPVERFASIIREGIRAGVFRKVDPLLAAGWTVALAQRAIRFRETGWVRLSARRVRTETVEAALRMLH